MGTVERIKKRPIESGAVATTELGGPKLPTREEYLKRLDSQNRGTVLELIEVSRKLAVSYHRQEVPFPGFMALYAIGGTITKTGDRPDLDLLFASNAVWPGAFKTDAGDLDGSIFDLDPEDRAKRLRQRQLREDTVCGTIAANMGIHFTINPITDLPTNYDMGAQGDATKGLLRLEPIRTPGTTPQEDSDYRKPVDLVYVRMDVFDSATSRTTTRTDFETQIDVQPDGQPLPRVLLYSSEDLGNVISMH